MVRAFTPKMVTANDLLEGDVIYLTKSNQWSRNLADAHVFTVESEANEALELALAQQDQLVGPYLVDATPGENGQPTSLHFREEFRSRGPSNYHHGKQAEV